MTVDRLISIAARCDARKCWEKVEVLIRHCRGCGERLLPRHPLIGEGRGNSYSSIPSSMCFWDSLFKPLRFACFAMSVTVTTNRAVRNENATEMNSTSHLVLVLFITHLSGRTELGTVTVRYITSSSKGCICPNGRNTSQLRNRSSRHHILNTLRTPPPECRLHPRRRQRECDAPPRPWMAARQYRRSGHADCLRVSRSFPG